MQSNLFPVNEPFVHDLPDAHITEFPSAFSLTESAEYMKLLKSSIAWSQASIRIAGKSVAIPRLQCWIADPGLSYSYSGILMQPQPWPAVVQSIKTRVEQLSGHQFNAVLANLYRDGSDSVAWHSDDEPELGPNPVVASVSFGADRPFELKHKVRSELSKVRIELHDGSLILMSETMQNNWLHQIPKVRSLKQARINLTFRHIIR